MKKENYSILLERYLKAREEGKEPYFDADEIDYMLDSFEEKEDFTHYEGVLTLGLKLHPMSIDLKIRKCKFHLYNEEFNEALALVDNISETNNMELDMIRLECYCTLDQYKKALDFLDKLLADTSCDYIENIFEFLAQVLIDLGMLKEGDEIIHRGLKAYPDNYILKEELCYLYEINGNHAEAIRLCNEMIDKKPYSYDSWFTLGRLYSLTNEFDKAIDAFDFAITCDVPDMELLTLKAYCLFMNENYKKALDVYKELMDSMEQVDRVKQLMADCYIKLDEYEEGYQLLKKLMDDSNSKIEVTTYINFFHCCIETDRKEEASQSLAKAAKLFPDNVRILSLLALSHIENDKEDLALSITNKIFRQLDQMKKGYTDEGKHIPPEDLIKEYLNNKKNSN
ncbi:tetratricopeptide (TPR) repeat protein [Parabacteroides sp. PF5-5]|uniref:tetratricopeptide repeat protein n=1 Tax=unclassified Parabacteroides TaxID=2649774 RepID=UPI00247304DE|nr:MULTISPECIES: tetratricopeptide repeat protein [unclassified Parabacteroides]MDH6305668.1 tetratricopeptide (TPR) repeat protein [Parabacteroides sp. PH5-39]MDH6316740.1 tetratricopeptide (TPR) repeat protein [Parabacteroides sp. PF5-13]MDH6320381.1 tetratricopeptide (TPR) repeat protein [Parabacteroides sp. PH5-13]MDH6324111.1 tetratricopeptide (TPR) repeat protein [Parabacteroides sp. PH5-8]MDH6327926.1 tetratricopeptide (TPR) repeat protein [Parabacteroides sp. PH5-41]